VAGDDGVERAAGVGAGGSRAAARGGGWRRTPETRSNHGLRWFERVSAVRRLRRASSPTAEATAFFAMKSRRALTLQLHDPTSGNGGQTVTIAMRNIDSIFLDTAGILRFSTHVLFSALMLIASGSVISVIAELTSRGIVGPNGGAGIRIASVMRSESTWKIGHRAARGWLHAAATALVGSGLLSLLAPRIADSWLPIGMASAFCFLIVSAFVASRAARRSEASILDD